MSWGLVAVAGATLVGGALSSKASGKAADVQAQAASEGQEAQRAQFDITRADQAPFLAAGTGALEQQQALLGLQGPEAGAAAMQQFQESPGQKFLRERQERALLRNQSAIGGLGGGNIRTALQEQAAGIAATQLGDYQNRLASLSGQGQVTAQNLGSLGGQYAGNLQQSLASAGQARATGIQGQAAAQGQTLTNLAQLGGQYLGRTQ